MSFPFFLSIIAIISGSLLRWLIFPIPKLVVLSLFNKLLVIFVCLVGGLFGYFSSNVSLFFLNNSLKLYIISFFLGNI